MFAMRKCLLLAGLLMSMLSISVSAAPFASKLTSFVKEAKNALVLGIAAGIIVCNSGCEDSQHVVRAKEPNPLTIGMLTTLPKFVASENGARLAIKQANMRGGAHGSMIELYVANNEGDVNLSLSLAEKFMLQDYVNAIVGPEFSTHAVKVAGYAQRYEVPMVTTAATNPNVTRAGNYISMAAFTDNFQGEVMADLAYTDFGARSAAVLYQEADVYSQGLADTFASIFHAKGGEVSYIAGYEAGQTDFYDILSQVKAKSVDTVFIPGFTPEVPLIVKEAMEIGIEAIYMGGDGWETGDLLAIGGEAMEGSNSRG